MNYEGLFVHKRAGKLMGILNKTNVEVSRPKRLMVLTLIGLWGMVLVLASAGFELKKIGLLQALLSTGALVMVAAVSAAFRLSDKRQARSEGRAESLVTCSAALSTGVGALEAIAMLLRSAVQELDAVCGYVMLADQQDPNLLKLETAFCTDDSVSAPAELRKGQDLTGYVFERNQPIILNKTSGSTPLEFKTLSIPDRSVICVPLAAKPHVSPGRDQSTQTLGALTLLGECFNSEDLEFLIGAASLMSLAISRSRIEGKQLELLMRTIQQMAAAFEDRDEYTKGHSDRVCELSLLLAEHLGFGADELTEIRIGTLLHDIGKLGIPEAIINKLDRLTEEESLVMRSYPVIGFELCKPLMLSEEAMMIIRNHREKLDGSGYPDGLKGGELPPLLRIVCVADVFDSMVSARRHRSGMHAADVMRELSGLAGSQFDPAVVQALRDISGTAEYRKLYETSSSQSIHELVA